MGESLPVKKELLQKLSIIKFFAFKPRHYSLGRAIRYIHYKKEADFNYLHANEKDLQAFLYYIIDGHSLAGKHLSEINPLGYTIANAIIDYTTENKENLEVLSPEANLFLEYVNTKNKKILVEIAKWERGEVVYNYLDYVVNDCVLAKEFLQNRAYNTFAFVNGLMNNEKKALNYFLKYI